MGKKSKKWLRRNKDKLKKKNKKKEEFEVEKPSFLKKDIRLLSACEDCQTAADVGNVKSFELPDPKGKEGGACTSALLKVLYKDHKTPEDTLSFTQVLKRIRKQLDKRNYKQIPQLSSCNPIDVNVDFDLVPPEATGVRRAVMIGINYIGVPGTLKGCHNDVLNMKEYIMNVHGFEEDNINILMDKDDYTSPTRKNILTAYKQVVKDSQPGDAIYLHYSGHGITVKDDNGDEEDGLDEALVPLDFQQSGIIRDDQLYKILVCKLQDGVHMFSLMDCCHSGTILDLPYVFKEGMTNMELDETIDADCYCNYAAELEETKDDDDDEGEG